MKIAVAFLALTLAVPAFAQQPTGGRLIREPDRLIATKPEKAPNVQEFVRSLELQNGQDQGFGATQPPAQKPEAVPSGPSCPADATREYAEANKCQLLHGVMNGRRLPDSATAPKPGQQ